MGMIPSPTLFAKFEAVRHFGGGVPRHCVCVRLPRHLFRDRRLPQEAQMQTSLSQTISVPIATRPLADRPAAAHAIQPAAEPRDLYYRVLGIFLASGFSAMFWVGVLAIVMPAWNTAPSTPALVITGLAIATVVSVSVWAITSIV